MDKEVGILSVAYCEENHRIGAILTSGTMVFWEGHDSFATEKSIPIKQLGDKIYYLSQQGQWATVSHNALHFWDLKEETTTQSIQCP